MSFTCRERATSVVCTVRASLGGGVGGGIGGGVLWGSSNVGGGGDAARGRRSGASGGALVGAGDVGGEEGVVGSGDGRRRQAAAQNGRAATIGAGEVVCVGASSRSDFH
jgi:hypothetical protein